VATWLVAADPTWLRAGVSSMRCPLAGVGSVGENVAA
jgi:hypothetical protein